MTRKYPLKCRSRWYEPNATGMEQNRIKMIKLLLTSSGGKTVITLSSTLGSVRNEPRHYMACACVSRHGGVHVQLFLGYDGVVCVSWMVVSCVPPR